MVQVLEESIHERMVGTIFECMHRTSSNYCNVLVPEVLLLAYSARRSVQNRPVILRLDHMM